MQTGGILPLKQAFRQPHYTPDDSHTIRKWDFVSFYYIYFVSACQVLSIRRAGG